MSGIVALRAAVRLLGSEKAVAEAVGVTQPTVNYTLNKSKVIPAEWCIPLETATADKGSKIPRGAFRPDIYPDEHHGWEDGGDAPALHGESAAVIPAGESA